MIVDVEDIAEVEHALVVLGFWRWGDKPDEAICRLQADGHVTASTRESRRDLLDFLGRSGPGLVIAASSEASW